MKTYTIRVSRPNYRTGGTRTHDWTGTLPELIEIFKYTLECGKSWEHEKGNRKINMAPKSAGALVNNLNYAEYNTAANGYSSTSYELV